MGADLGAPRLVVVGGVSVDRISTPRRHGVQVLGGGGLYAALAAATRTTVGLVGISSDHPLTAGRPWRPAVSDAGLITLPHRGLAFDISYDADGRATYHTDHAGDEQYLLPGDMPPVYRGATGFHLCALGDPGVQLQYATALRGMSGARRARISAGTFLARIAADRRTVLRMIDTCDVFVCSAPEAVALAAVTHVEDALAWLSQTLAGPGREVVVTDAASGCHVLTHDAVRRIPTFPRPAVDPTGAGEAFSGALAACLVEGDELLSAAGYACAVASLVVEDFGAAALLQPNQQVLATRVTAVRRSVVEAGS
ncbi:PfkB family carbohydrate kinase [Micromonospora sp. DH14]|uniref:carbohydrate kinase family protein n=1 Tax=Micromonospora sp. DH14 TaxID=3040120 RepID=UPI002442DB00|nr:PfkB family carbohydrate kinase [Micromonospora sp. DH14]MDG9674800.1 PfkB family carbohydrate kinase [Micromonospora sp. DH14]